MIINSQVKADASSENYFQYLIMTGCSRDREIPFIGIGRTGTIVGLEVANQMFDHGEKVSMREIVQEMRKQRHGSVQTDIQYVYMHRCIVGLSENKKV